MFLGFQWRPEAVNPPDMKTCAGLSGALVWSFSTEGTAIHSAWTHNMFVRVWTESSTQAIL